MRNFKLKTVRLILSLLLCTLVTETARAISCNLSPDTAMRSGKRIFVNNQDHWADYLCKREGFEICEIEASDSRGQVTIAWGYHLIPVKLNPQEIWQQTCMKALICQNDLFNSGLTDENSTMQREQIAAILVANKCNPP